MRRSIVVSALAASAALLSACATSIEPGPAQIRLVNTGTVAFDSVVVNFPGLREVYPALPAGGTSGYRPVSMAYRYAAIAAWAGTVSYILQPIDYVGERPLDAGRYSYMVHAVVGSGTLGLELRTDD